MSELTYKAERSLKQAREAVEELGKEVLRLETALDDQTGVVMPLEPYPIMQETYNRNMRSWESPELARRKAEEAYAASLPLVEKNRKIIEVNRRVLAKITQFIVNSKICTTMQVPSKSRKRWAPRLETITADWYHGMVRAIPAADNWEECQRRYKERLEECDRWKREIEHAKEEADRIERLAQARREREIQEALDERLRQQAVEKIPVASGSRLVELEDKDA